MITRPIYQNPLAGGQKILVPNPSAVTPRGGTEMIDPIMQGFQDSEFRKNANMMQQDAVNFKYKGRDMMMNSSMAGAFKQYLDSIGQGDLFESEVLSAGPLKQVEIGDQLNPLNPVPGYQQATPSTPNTESFSQTVKPPLLDGTKGFPITVSGPETIASVNPFEEQFIGFQNQLTGFGDQFTSLNDRLTKIEEGISSLLGNRGQGVNLGFSPMQNFGMGLGSLFSPYGGFYGQRF
tara:strand:- start:79 stop:783 length:705 start_codon:yes stop_codon:yes gene_type:complete